MRQAYVHQHDSARQAANRAGLRHGSKAEAEVTVGLTPMGAKTSRPATAIHFCSAEVRVKRVLQVGREGIPFDTPVALPNGLPAVDRPVFARFDATVVSNGTLRICSPRNARFVVIPEELDESIPWAHADGPMDVAETLGCSSIDEMFDRHGVSVLT